MISIWKFPFAVADELVLEMPEGAQPIKVDLQKHTPTLWALVDTSAGNERREFVIVGTGHRINNIDKLTYIGTFQTDGGALVWHLFSKGSGR